MPTETTGSIDLTIYKQTSLENAKNRTVYTLSETHKAQATTIVSNFITHMKNKHS